MEVVPPIEQSPGQLSPEIMVAVQNATMEQLGFAFGAVDDEGADIHSTTNFILESTKRGKEPSPEQYKNLGENFDAAVLSEVNSIIINFKDLYPAGDWELETQLKSFHKVTTRYERRIEKLTRAGGESAEKMAFLESAHKRMLWAEGVMKVLAGNTISLLTYYAGEKRIQNIPNIKITQDDLRKAFYKELEGISPDIRSEYILGREEITKMQADAFDLSLKIASLHQDEAEVVVSSGVSTKPRERERQYLDGRTRQMLTEIFAVRYDNDVSDKDGRTIYRKGDIKTIDWIDPKTGNKHKVPAEILNYYALSKTTDEYKKYSIALSTSAVALGALDMLKEGRDPIEIGRLVRNRADQLVAMYDARQSFGSVKDKYAEMAVRTIMAQHIGQMTAGELGWGWNYEVAAWGEGTTNNELEPIEKKYFDKSKVRFDDLNPVLQEQFKKRRKTEENDGKVWTDPEYFVVLRVREMGSIYTADDIPSPFYPEDFVRQYASRSETASELYWGLADSDRRMSRYFRPDWRPKLFEKLADGTLQFENLAAGEMGKNTTQEILIRALLSGQYETSKARDGKPYGKMDYRMRNYIEQYAGAWQTWVEDKNKNPYSMPLFFPPAWYSLNFWRSLGAASEAGKDGDVIYKFGGKTPEAPSLMEKFWEGLRIDEVDFTKYADQATDWDNVNRVQLAKGLVGLFLSYQFSQDGANVYGNYEARPLNINTLRDWDKRMGRLGVRGENVVAGVTGMLTFIPFAVKVIADQSGVATLADPSVEDSEKRKIRTKFQKEIRKFKVNASYLAKTKGLSKTGLTNFNRTYAMWIDFYSRIQLEWSIKSFQQTSHDEQDEGNLLEPEFDDVLVRNNVKVIRSVNT